MLGEEFAIDFVGSNDGPYYGQQGFWGRLVLKLFVVYLLVAYWSWEELRYCSAAIELPARVERIGGARNGLIVRYTFTDPVSRTTRHNTVTICESQFPKSGNAQIQFIPGENPQSRLFSQARPSAVWVFVGINGALAVSFVALIAYIAWQANRPYVTPQQRMVAAYRRKHELPNGWLNGLKSKYRTAK